MSKINDNHQTTDAGSSENNRKHKCQQMQICFNTKAYCSKTTENQRQRENLERSQGGKKNTHVTYRGRKIRITLDFSSETTQARRE